LPGGGSVRMQALTAGEMRALNQSLLNPDGRLNQKRGGRMKYVLLAWVLIDENGNRLFTDEDAMSNDFELLDGAIITYLFEKAKEFTGFLSDGDFTAIEAAVKNSESTPGS